MPSKEDKLYQRVAEILDTARGQVVRSVNSSMVHSYWLIGREIVLVEQGGEDWLRGPGAQAANVDDAGRVHAEQARQSEPSGFDPERGVILARHMKTTSVELLREVRHHVGQRPQLRSRIVCCFQHLVEIEESIDLRPRASRYAHLALSGSMISMLAVPAPMRLVVLNMLNSITSLHVTSRGSGRARARRSPW